MAEPYQSGAAGLASPFHDPGLADVHDLLFVTGCPAFKTALWAFIYSISFIPWAAVLYLIYKVFFALCKVWLKLKGKHRCQVLVPLVPLLPHQNVASEKLAVSATLRPPSSISSRVTCWMTSSLCWIIALLPEWPPHGEAYQ